MQQKKNINHRIYIIVLNWNQYALTADCIRSLMKIEYPSYQIIVVDNHSQDGTPEKIKSEFGKQIELITNTENLGFSGGNNVGIRYALEHGAEHIMLLNNDTIVDSNFLTPLIEILQANKKIGAITPKIYYLHNPNLIWAVGGKINRWSGKAYSRGRGELDIGQYDQSEPVDYATGCCILFSKKALHDVGLLKEQYFAYWEDSDWCMRARNSNFIIWYESSSIIWHAVGASSKKNKSSKWKGLSSPIKHYLTCRNNIWFIRYHLHGMIYIIALISFSIRRLLFFSIALIVLGRWNKLKSMWQGVYDGWFTYDSAA